MAAQSNDRKERTGITVLFERGEKRMIRQAAVETEVRSSSEFIRQAAVKAAQKVVGGPKKAA